MTAIAWLLWWLLAGTCLVGTWSWIRRAKELIAPLPICLATIAFYVLPRAGYLLWFGRPPLASAGLAPDKQTALIAESLMMALFAAIAFVIGYRSPNAGRTGRAIKFQLPQADVTRTLWVGLVLFCAGAAVLLYLVHAAGDLQYLLKHQYEVGVILGNKVSLFYLARLTTISAGLLLVDEARRRSRWWVWLMAVATFIAFIPFGYRVFIVSAIGYPLALYHLTLRRLTVRTMLILGTAASAFLFAFNYVRLLGARRVQEAAGGFLHQPSKAVHFAFNASGELKIFDAMTLIVRDVPSSIPFNYGATFARVPFMAVPRRVWPEKPVTLGHIIVRRYLPYLKTAYPPMAVGEFFAAAGLLGVLLGFAAFGWLGRVGWEWHLRRPGAGNANIYLTFCFFVYDFTRVGDPSRTGWFFLIGIAFFVVAFSIAAAPREQGAGPAGTIALRDSGS